MLDINKHIELWRNGAIDTLQTATDLLKQSHYDFALFAAHLALEKAIKALVCRATGEIPPRLHNLLRLIEIAEVKPDAEMMDFLSTMNQYSQIGRYPEFLTVRSSKAETIEAIAQTKEAIQWLMSL